MYSLASMGQIDHPSSDSQTQHKPIMCMVLIIDLHCMPYCGTFGGIDQWILLSGCFYSGNTPVSGSETPHCEDWKHTSAGGGVHEVPWAVVGLAPLI